MRTNTKAVARKRSTHNGGPASVHVSSRQELRRAVMACLLFERAFYESGSAHAAFLAQLVEANDPVFVAEVAVEARERFYLRHVPLFLARELARQPKSGAIVAPLLERIIQRPDELTEYLALYWKGAPSSLKGRKQPGFRLSAGSKRGLARAARKFSAHQLAKYDRDGQVTLRDVWRLVHPTPASGAQALLFKQVVTRTLETPDTWETELSAGKGKRETFERLLREQKLGGLAFLRNLRNMEQAGVDRSLILERFQGEFPKVLPFRFLAALRHAPSFAQALESAMLRSASSLPKLPGESVLLVDVSGSMSDPISGQSEMNRLDTAKALAILLREVCESVRIYTFNEHIREVPAYRGLALDREIGRGGGGTSIGSAVARAPKSDRLIVLTDEQSSDRVSNPRARYAYMVNVATYANGVGYAGPWVHVDGFSERIVDFIALYESEACPHPDA